MERREALKRLLLGATVAPAAVGGLQVPTEMKVYYGAMTPDRWHAEGFHARQARVLIDGVDITPRCRWFDDRTGEACVLTGQPPSMVKATGAAEVETRILRGVITVVG